MARRRILVTPPRVGRAIRGVEMSVSEIAEALGIAVCTVEESLRSALAKLRASPELAAQLGVAPLPDGWRVCRWMPCSMAFEPRSPAQGYCRDACAVAGYRAGRREATKRWRHRAGTRRRD